MPETAESEPDTEEFSTERVRPASQLRSLPTAAVVVALLALVVAPWLPWQTDVTGWGELAATQARLRTSGEQTALFALVPTVLLWVVALVWPVRLAVRAAELVTAVGTVFLLFTAIRPPEGQEWPGVGMGLAVFGYPVALVAGLAFDVVVSRHGRPPVRALAALVTVVVLGAGIGYGVHWYSADRLLDRTTSAAAPAAPVPDEPGTVLWQNALAGGVVTSPSAMLAGGLVALRTAPGEVVVRDAGTGAERWHYARGGTAEGGLAASDDGRTVLADFVVRDRDFVVALDSATGNVRWQRWQPAGTQTILLPTAALTLFPDNVHAYGESAEADDPATGARLWSSNLGQWCQGPQAMTGVAGLTIVLTPCGGDGTGTSGVRAIGSTGRVRWTGPAQKGGEDAPSSFLQSNASALVVYGPTNVELLNPATGRVPWALKGSLVAAGGGRALLVEGETPGAGHLVVRDLATGVLADIQPTAAALPPDSSVAAADIRGDQAYLLVKKGPDGMSVTDVDLRSGRLVGSWPVPGAGKTILTESGTTTLHAGNGTVLITMQSYPNAESVAIRVP